MLTLNGEPTIGRLFAGMGLCDVVDKLKGIAGAMLSHMRVVGELVSSTKVEGAAEACKLGGGVTRMVGLVVG